MLSCPWNQWMYSALNFSKFILSPLAENPSCCTFLVNTQETAASELTNKELSQLQV